MAVTHISHEQLQLSSQPWIAFVMIRSSKVRSCLSIWMPMLTTNPGYHLSTLMMLVKQQRHSQRTMVWIDVLISLLEVITYLTWLYRTAGRRLYGELQKSSGQELEAQQEAEWYELKYGVKLPGWLFADLHDISQLEAFTITVDIAGLSSDHPIRAFELA